MKKLYILLLLCAAVSMAQAQKITRDYQTQSMSRVLEDLNTAPGDTKYPSSTTTWRTLPLLAVLSTSASRTP